jgi:hypothetical protein
MEKLSYTSFKILLKGTAPGSSLQMEEHHCCWTNINVVTPSTQQYEPVSLIKDFFHHKNY